MIVSGCAEVGAGTAAFASSDSPGSGAVTKPVARVRITGAVHADYQVTDQRLCHTETFSAPTASGCGLAAAAPGGALPRGLTVQAACFVVLLVRRPKSCGLRRVCGS